MDKKPGPQCSEYVMVAHFRDHPCRLPTVTFEDGKWWCTRHSEAGQRRARHKAKARRLAIRDRNPVQ